MMLYAMLIPLLPYLLESMSRPDKDAGLFFGAYAVGLFIFTPVWGLVSDRYCSTCSHDCRTRVAGVGKHFDVCFVLIHLVDIGTILSWRQCRGELDCRLSNLRDLIPQKPRRNSSRVRFRCKYGRPSFGTVGEWLAGKSRRHFGTILHGDCIGNSRAYRAHHCPDTTTRTNSYW